MPGLQVAGRGLNAPPCQSQALLNRRRQDLETFRSKRLDLDAQLAAAIKQEARIVLAPKHSTVHPAAPQIGCDAAVPQLTLLCAQEDAGMELSKLRASAHKVSASLTAVRRQLATLRCRLAEARDTSR